MFAAFATVLAALRCGVGTALLQLVRCTIVVIEIGMFAYTLRHLGLAEVLVWATLFGFAVFGESPGAWTVIGIVVGSGLYAMFRERVRKGAEAVPTSMLASSGLSEDMVHPQRDDAPRHE